MAPKGAGGMLAQTRDHYIPKSVGGRRTVRCCFFCNQVKGDTPPNEFRAFTVNVPHYFEMSMTRAHRELRAFQVRFVERGFSGQIPTYPLRDPIFPGDPRYIVNEVSEPILRTKPPLGIL